MAQPEIHGPMRIIAGTANENTWGGNVVFTATGSSVVITNLSTKALKASNGRVFLFPSNGAAARLVTGQVAPAQTTNQRTGVYATIPADGQLKIFFNASGGSCRFNFLVVTGGTFGV
jgi:hypothetical protein